MIPTLAEARPAIADLCRRFGVRRLDVFGSAARGTDFTDTSDIDLLVEYEPDRGLGLRDHFSFRDALSGLFGRTIDLIEARAIRNPYLREEVESSRQALHET